MGGKIGSFSFVLHSHLPYVLSHGQWPHGMDWIHEAAAGCYLPLLRALRSLADRGRATGVTLGVTPVLSEQLADKDFLVEFDRYLERRLEFAEENQRQFRLQGQEHMASLAAFWLEHIERLRSLFNRELNRDMIGAVRELQDGGMLETITCGATHGYFPLLSRDESIRMQVAQGVKTHRRHFGSEPKGIWLPECAYRPSYDWSPPTGRSKPRPRAGVEEILAEFGINYFITDSHMLKGGRAIGTYLDRFDALRKLWVRYEAGTEVREEDKERSTMESYWVASNTGQENMAACYTRDPETAVTVWSAEVGYPGDGWYLDFHKKHFPGGLRYWRVTKSQSDLADKEPYQPEKVEARLRENADHFVSVVKGQLTKHLLEKGAPGHLIAPFDTELFGHWWFEGPRFLEMVLSRLAASDEVELKTCGARLEESPPGSIISLPEGSWGQGGFHYIWLNDDTQWTWPHIYKCETTMAELKGLYPGAQGELKDVLDQAARELLLLQASDWQFLISTWSARDYAEMRFTNHVEEFNRLADIARGLAAGGSLSPGDASFLASSKKRDRLFPDVSLDDFK